jgi:hypothetical protein
MSTPSLITTPSVWKSKRHEAEHHLDVIFNGYSNMLASVTFLMGNDGRDYQLLLLDHPPHETTSWSAVVTFWLLLDSASRCDHELVLPVTMFDNESLRDYFGITNPIQGTLVTWQCARTDPNTLYHLCNNALVYIQSESKADELTPYSLSKGILQALFGFDRHGNPSFIPTFSQLHARWQITLQAYLSRTSGKARKASVSDASVWRLRSVSPMGETANSKGCYMSAEDCVKVTASSFKMAIEKLLKKGSLNIQLGFTMTSSNSIINSRNQQMSIMHEVPLQTPNGKVLGFVWLVKGSITSLAAELLEKG